MFPCATGPKHTLFLQTAPERWVPLLRSCHEAFRNGEDPNGDGLHTFAHILSDMAKVYPKDGGKYHWQCLFEQDAIHVVVQLLCDLDFTVDIKRCGLTATVRRPVFRVCSIDVGLCHRETICPIFWRYSVRVSLDCPESCPCLGMRCAT